MNIVNILTSVSSIILEPEDQVKCIPLWNTDGIPYMYDLANVEH